ncbi:helix-turn-helix domain-containing protein [Planctomycetaceae bacterium SH139]
MSIQKRVRQVIEFDDYKSNALADKLEIPRPTLSRFVNEVRGIQFDYLQRICNFLQLELVRIIDDPEVYCEEVWKNGGLERAKLEFELRKDEAWDAYLEENFEPDPQELNAFAEEQWRAYALREWPAYAEMNALDVTDVDEVACWREHEYSDWLEALTEQWEEQAKEAWIDQEYEEWSQEYDDKLEDEEFLFEFFREWLMESMAEQPWIYLRGSAGKLAVGG